MRVCWVYSQVGRRLNEAGGREEEALSARAISAGLIAALGLVIAGGGQVAAQESFDPPLSRRDFIDALYPMVKRMEAHGAIVPSRTPAIVVFADLHGPERDRAIELSSRYHLFSGMPALSSGRFNGMLPVTRWEAGTVLGELLARTRPEARELLPGDRGPTVFSDLTEAEYGRLEPIIARGLLIGYPDQTFRTQEPLTQAQWSLVSQKLKALEAYQAPPSPPRERKSLEEDYFLLRGDRER